MRYPQMSDAKRPRGRPPKFPPEVVRERLIDAAISTLLETGVGTGLDTIGLDAIISDAEVPRGMAYKIWQDSELTPQDALRHDVVIRLLNLPTLTGFDATSERVAEEMSNLKFPAKTDSPEQRRLMVSELVRVVGHFNHDALDVSPEWKLYNAVRAVAITQSDLDPEISALLEHGENQITERYAELYQLVADAFGVQLSENFTMHQFSAAAYALNEGLSARMFSNVQLVGIERKDAEGETHEWALFSIGLEALVYHFFEL